MDPKAKFDFSFQHDIWITSLDEQIQAYTYLIDILEDKIAMETYLSNRVAKIGQFEEQEGKNKWPENLKKYVASSAFQMSVPEAINTYSRQMIVVAASYLENIISNFFAALFYKYPNRMYDFVGKNDNESKGKVDLHDVLNANSKDEMLVSLAKQAASNAVQGKNKIVINRLDNLCDKNLDPILLKRVAEVFEQRNQILHELSESEVKPKDVQVVFELVELFLHDLMKTANKLGLLFG